MNDTTTITVRRATNGTDRIVSKVYVAGYAFNRNGTAWLRLGDRMRSAMRRWPDDSDRDARDAIRAMLDEWIPRAYGGDTVVVTDEPRFVGELVAAWSSGPGQTTTKHMRRSMADAVAMAFADDCPLAIGPLVDRISAASANGDYAPATKHKFLKMLKRLFRWGCDMGFIDRNPVVLVGIKPLPKKEHVAVFTEQETTILSWHQANRDIGSIEPKSLRGVRYYTDHRHANAGLLFRWQFYTGMRIGETLALRWRDVRDDEIKILDSKGKEERNFPVAAFPVVGRMLDELRTHRTSNDPAAFVFPWFRSTSRASQILNEAMDQLGMSRVNPTRTLHSFRASAEKYMEDVLGLSTSLVCVITGHSIAVHEKHYRHRRPGKELAALVERERAAKHPPTNDGSTAAR